MWLIIFDLIGLKTIPDKPEQIGLNNTLNRAYFNLHLSEIVLAYEMAIEESLDVDPTHYQSFSSLYLCNILNAYKEWKRKEQLAINKLKEEADLKLKAIPVGDDPERAYNFLKKHYKEKHLIGNWNDGYLYAEREGLINHSVIYKRKYWKALKITLKDELRDLRINGNPKDIQQKQELLNSDKLLQLEARKRLLIEYFNKL